MMTCFGCPLRYLAAALLLAAYAAGAFAAGAPAAKEAATAAAAFSRADPIPDWVQPIEIPATKRRDAIVIRLADSQFRMGNKQVSFINRAFQVNDSSSLSEIGQYQIQFVPEYQKLRLHRVAILRGDEVTDQTRTVGVRFLERETALEQGIYSGAVTASLLLSDVRVGDTVSIAYSVEGSNPVFGNYVSMNASWDHRWPTELRNVTLSYPEKREVDWKLVGEFKTTVPHSERSSAHGYRILRWQERGIEGTSLESYVPASYLPYRFLQFSEYRSWNDVAKWATGLFPPVESLPAELKTLLDSLRHEASDEQCVLKALRWVQTEIRYFSVSLGESAQRPYPPAVVVRRRFGDCKDKAYLLVSVLRELGIEARPVLVSLTASKVPGKLLPTPDAFDHVVVQITLGDRQYYVDGTRLEQRGPLSQLNALPDGIEGLVVAPDTEKLVSIRASAEPGRHTTELVERFSVPKLGDTGALSSETTWRGADAEMLRLAVKRMTPEQLRKLALGIYERRYPGVSLVGEPTVRDHADTNAVTLAAQFSVPKLTAEYGGEWGMKFYPHTFIGIVNMPQEVTRTFPLIAMRYPFSVRYELAVTWPPEVAAVHDPSYRQLSNEFFGSDVAVAFRGNLFTERVTFESKRDVVTPDQVSKLLAALKDFEKSVRGYVTVDRREIKNAGVLGLGKTSLQESMRRRLESSVERTGKAISTGKLGGEDLAEALCDRAEGYADLGQADKGISDAAEAVRIAPQLARAWSCRANLNFALGEFAKAVSDYTKAINLGAEPFHGFYRRGHARFYLGKLAEAADDFGKAVNATSDESEKIYAGLWQAWTLQRLNKPLPNELVALAAKNPQGAWPRPALAMFTAVLSPDQVLAEVEKMAGDERELNLAEAYFYIGQFRRNQGQVDEARELFRKVREKGITVYIEHVAAAFELAPAKVAKND